MSSLRIAAEKPYQKASKRGKPILKANAGRPKTHQIRLDGIGTPHRRQKSQSVPGELLGQFCCQQESDLPRKEVGKQANHSDLATGPLKCKFRHRLRNKI